STCSRPAGPAKASAPPGARPAHLNPSTGEAVMDNEHRLKRPMPEECAVTASLRLSHSADESRPSLPRNPTTGAPYPTSCESSSPTREKRRRYLPTFET